MASSTPNKILLTVNGERRPLFEDEANVVLTPGELVRFNSANGNLEPHGTANGAAAKMFIVENPYVEIEDGKNIDADWAVGEYARYIRAQSGDEVYAWLADGENVAKGAPLGSDGAGALQALTMDATVIEGALVCRAAEALNNSAGGARARIKVHVA